MHEMDLTTGAREFEDLDDEEEEEFKGNTFKEKAIYQLKNW